MKRPLMESEKTAIYHLAEILPVAMRSQIITDLSCASVEPLNESGSIIRFEIENYRRVPNMGRRAIVDAVAKDSDGAHLNVILFSDENDRLYELEIIRFEDGDVIAPDWKTLTVY